MSASTSVISSTIGSGRHIFHGWGRIRCGGCRYGVGDHGVGCGHGRPNNRITIGE